MKTEKSQKILLFLYFFKIFYVYTSAQMSTRLSPIQSKFELD